jgi:hypothetical protein
MAAILSDSSQARRKDMIAPFEWPVANTRLGSMSKPSRKWSISAEMKATSSTFWRTDCPQQAPPFQVRPMPSG